MELSDTIYFAALAVSIYLIVGGAFYVTKSTRFIDYSRNRIHELELKLESQYEGQSQYSRYRNVASFLRSDEAERRHYALLTVCLGGIPILAGTMLLACLVFAVAPPKARSTSLSESTQVSDVPTPAPVAFGNASAAAGPNGAYLLAYTAGIMRQREMDNKPQLSASELALLLQPLADVGVASVENISNFSKEFLLELGKKGIDVAGDLIFEGFKSLIPAKAKAESLAASVPICNVTVNMPADVPSQAPVKPNKTTSPRPSRKPKEPSSCQMMQPPPSRSDSTLPLS